MFGKLNIQKSFDNFKSTTLDLNVNNKISNSIKTEFLNLITSSAFVNNLGGTSISSNITAISSFKENGFIVAHENNYDAINNNITVVNLPNENSFENSSIFFDDSTRRTYTNGSIVYFEQTLKNTTFSSQKITAFSLIKNPIQFKSIFVNGQFEDSVLIGVDNGASASLSAQQSLYGISNSFVVTSTGSPFQHLFTKSSGNWTNTAVSSITSTVFELSYIAKADVANIRSRIALILNETPNTSIIDISNSNTPLTWASTSATGAGSASLSSLKLAIYGHSSATNDNVYYDCVRVRPLPMFTARGQLGTQVSYVLLDTPIDLLPDEVIKISWSVNFNYSQVIPTIDIPRVGPGIITSGGSRDGDGR